MSDRGTWLSLTRARRVLALGILVCATLALSGCMASKSRNFGSGSKPAIARGDHKRYPLHMERDYIHRVRRKAYKHTPKNFTEQRHEGDKALIAAALGAPNTVRRPFKSRQGEIVDEWIYFEDNHVFQFTGDTLVYQGPVTDLERTLLVYGYPSTVVWSFHEPASTNLFLVYSNPWTLEEKRVFLANDMIEKKQEEF